MKAYFLFITSQDFPMQALTKQFSKHTDAMKICLDKLWELQGLFDFNCIVTHHYKRQGLFRYSIIEDTPNITKKKIYLQVVRCDVSDPATMYNQNK